MRRIFPGFLVFLILSCSADFNKVVPDNVNQFAIGFVKKIKNGKLDECMTEVSDEMNNDGTYQYLARFFDQLRVYKVDSFKIINAGKREEGAKGTYYTIVYEYFVTAKHLYCYVRIHEQQASIKITSFEARFSEKSLTDEFTQKNQ